MTSPTEALILAAGKGSRMGDLPYQKSLLPGKSGKAILAYAMKSLYGAGFSGENINVMVGHKKESVMRYIENDARFVVQQALNGTGDAIRILLETMPSSTSTLVVMNGDDSLSYRASVVQELLSAHYNGGNAVSVSITDKYNANVHTRAYIPGREGALVRIADATKERGCYLTGLCVLEIAYVKKVIQNLVANGEKGMEFGITDFYKQAMEDGEVVRLVENPHAVLGMNTLADWKRNVV